MKTEYFYFDGKRLVSFGEYSSDVEAADAALNDDSAAHAFYIASKNEWQKIMKNFQESLSI